jgi:diguanylate cyclase (GGDEF)-like protein
LTTAVVKLYRTATLSQRLALIVVVSVVGSAAFCYTGYAVIGLPVLSGGVGGMVAFWAPIVTPAVVAPMVMRPLERANRRALVLLGQVEQARATLAAEMVERQRAQERLEHEVSHDHLTGVLNRRGFFQACQSRPAVPMTLCTVDVDQFKAINDSLGHMAGDMVLCALAEALLACAGEGAWVGRLGGDEFVVLDPDPSAGRIVAQCMAGWQVVLGEGVSCWVGASVGTSFLEAGASVDQALSAADRAMFRHKRARATDRDLLASPAPRLAEAEIAT